jgi:hypothetical protein
MSCGGRDVRGSKDLTDKKKKTAALIVDEAAEAHGGVVVRAALERLDE